MTKPFEPMQEIELQEALAQYAHDAWSGWMKYMFQKGTLNDDGTYTMPSWAVERWTRQMKLSYYELPESEKESDRDEAKRIIEILKEVGNRS